MHHGYKPNYCIINNKERALVYETEKIVRTRELLYRKQMWEISLILLKSIIAPTCII